jgi:hypothetical protein
MWAHEATGAPVPSTRYALKSTSTTAVVLHFCPGRHQRFICYPQTMIIATGSARPFRSLKVLFFLMLLVPCGSLAQSTDSMPAPPAASPAEFAQAADEVLHNMSEITGLSLVSPLKKTLRSRDDIRAYVIRQMDEDKDAAQRYADARAAEAFGLLPKNFDLDSFMVELLTEQIAGLYDPKAHEFYIADWIPLEDQRMVMAHELTHALEDQHFQIETWLKAARPNDDAELAREAFLEGSAMAAMVDYLLQGTGKSVNEIPEFDPSLLTGDIGDSPSMKKAPPFIKDALVFPYFAGMKFTAAALKPSGWSALGQVFKNPPVSTQQIMHPALYKSGHVPEKVALPDIQPKLGKDWKKLDDNLMGEFGWKEVLKQYLGEDRAAPLAAGWDGDRYLVYEHQPSKRLLLVTRLHLVSGEQANRFFGQYSELLEKKHEKRADLFRRPNFFSFETPDGGVFLRCTATECLTLEGGDRSLFSELNKQLQLGALPEPSQRPGATATRTADRFSIQPAISGSR